MSASSAKPVPMFRLHEVGKTYPGVTAVAPLTLQIEPGELVALVGPSGSGKTTLLNILGTLVAPDSGDMWIDGRSSGSLRPGRELARLVGTMHQQYDLVDSLSVVHNVLAGRLGEWGLWKSALSLIFPRDLHLAKVALDRVGIPEKLFERTSRLSGGEQQRVALARLMVQQPRAILADEPVSALDPARAKDMVGMLTGIAREQGLTLVASLHTVPLALGHFSRIVALRGGRLHFDLPAQQVGLDDMRRVYEMEGTVGRA